MSSGMMGLVLLGPRVDRSTALATAENDAQGAYGDLTQYQVLIRLGPDGWHIDYELADPKLQGGGPHYVIDSTSGQIVQKRYEQ